MKILADENIARVRQYFGRAGELNTMPGRAIDAAAVRDVDALLVRSVTHVDAGLLAGSRCRFVGTATSGIDHVDVDWLQRQGIAFGWARGCNANAVVDYVFAALAWFGLHQELDWPSLDYGIVGCGEVGSRLAARLLRLGCSISIHDPFLDDSHPLAAHFTTLEKTLSRRVLSLHTPLTTTGPWPTRHLLDVDRLAALPPDGVLINAARGAVVDNAALAALLAREPGRRVVLDAWEGEPFVNADLLRRVALGTPHIAGYSVEGKLAGTRMVAAAFNDCFGARLADEPDTGPEPVIELEMETGMKEGTQIDRLLLAACDIGRDAAAMRQACLGAGDVGSAFDALRRHYPERHEFSRYHTGGRQLTPEQRSRLSAVGFGCHP